MTDADLIAAMAAGDREAFARFYDRYAARVYPVVLGIVRDPADASDVLHEVLWETWQEAPNYDPAAGSPEAWLFTRARARAIARAGGRHGAAAQSLLDAPAEPAPVPPPADIRGALLRRAGASRRPGPLRWRRWAVGTAMAVVAAAALSGGFVAARYEARVGELAREHARLKVAAARDEAALREEAASHRRVIELLRSPATRVLELRGQTRAPGAVGRLIWDEASGGVLFAANLPPAPTGKVYALWTIAGMRPRAGGVFLPDMDGRAAVTVPPAPDGGSVTAFAVTLEPEAGAETPSGPTVFVARRTPQ